MKAIITTFNMTESLKENYAKIQCPECNTEYAIPKEAVKKPIKVKCTNCGYTWRHKNNINEPLDEEKISSLVNGKNLIDQSQYADDDRGDFDYDEDDLLKVIVPEAEDKIEDTKVTRDDSVGEENDVQENMIVLVKKMTFKRTRLSRRTMLKTTILNKKIWRKLKMMTK